MLIAVQVICINAVLQCGTYLRCNIIYLFVVLISCSVIIPCVLLIADIGRCISLIINLEIIDRKAFRRKCNPIRASAQRHACCHLFFAAVSYVHNSNILCAFRAKAVRELIFIKSESDGNGTVLRLELGPAGNISLLVFNRSIEMDIVINRVFSLANFVDDEICIVRNSVRSFKSGRDGNRAVAAGVDSLGGNRGRSRCRCFSRSRCCLRSFCRGCSRGFGRLSRDIFARNTFRIFFCSGFCILTRSSFF